MILFLAFRPRSVALVISASLVMAAVEEVAPLARDRVRWRRQARSTFVRRPNRQQ
ncbi:MAG TPA: hypothetical protein VMB79_10840 [Jatrophihabitans sp.]|nr:hypothetical protein [Jatrophihabitans sp.]